MPETRLRESPPFTVTGLDFSGAFNVKNRDGSESKVYICLFTCATTRAIHFELVSDMSTETFLLTFRRFAARRSIPHLIMSDNAKTFLTVNSCFLSLNSKWHLIDPSQQLQCEFKTFQSRKLFSTNFSKIQRLTRVVPIDEKLFTFWNTTSVLLASNLQSLIVRHFDKIRS